MASQLSTTTELPDTATALESKKNFIRVHDKRGSYKTLFVSENITTSDLLVELAAKFNVSSTASFGLFMKRNDTNQGIVQFNAMQHRENERARLLNRSINRMHARTHTHTRIISSDSLEGRCKATTTTSQDAANRG